jgi:hypothetical protein
MDVGKDSREVDGEGDLRGVDGSVSEFEGGSILVDEHPDFYTFVNSLPSERMLGEVKRASPSSGYDASGRFDNHLQSPFNTFVASLPCSMVLNTVSRVGSANSASSDCSSGLTRSKHASVASSDFDPLHYMERTGRGSTLEGGLSDDSSDVGIRDDKSATSDNRFSLRPSTTPYTPTPPLQRELMGPQYRRYPLTVAEWAELDAMTSPDGEVRLSRGWQSAIARGLAKVSGYRSKI